MISKKSIFNRIVLVIVTCNIFVSITYGISRNRVIALLDKSINLQALSQEERELLCNNVDKLSRANRETLVNGLTETLNNQKETECPICMEPCFFDSDNETFFSAETQKPIIYLSNCKHVFHLECLSRWANGDRTNCKTCPVCRDEYKEYKTLKKNTQIIQINPGKFLLICGGVLYCVVIPLAVSSHYSPKILSLLGYLFW